MEENAVLSELESLRNKIDDLEIRVGEILTKQLNIKNELDLIAENSEKTDSIIEEKVEVKFPDDYHFSEDLQKFMDNMIESQNSWLESVTQSMSQKTGLKGQSIFEEMNQHLNDRLQYLEMTKTLLQGPLLEELPPPEEPPVEEEVKEVKEPKGKGKKDGAKKGKKK